jgi:dolichyl-phosphate-mannose-protein mannosyltransferase
MSPPGPQSARRGAARDVLFSAALFALALLPRLYVALAWAREPVWDGHYYDFGARRIAAGFGYSDDVMVGGVARWHPWCHYPVGYSGFLALVYRVFGDGPRAAPVANAVVGALLAVVVHRLARQAMSPRRARVAGVLVALSPELVAYAALLMTEPLASVGPLASALIVMRTRARRPWIGAVAAGAVMGLTTLVRPQLVLAAPALGLVAFGPRGWREGLRRGLGVAAVATLACFAVVAPWTYRNCRVMDGCAFVSTNAGWNLAIGAFPRATGRFETLRGADGCPVVTGQVQQDRCWGKLGVEYIRHDTRRWLGLVPEKLAQTFDHASFPMGYLGEADPQRFDEERKKFGREWLTRAHGALLVGAAFVVVSRGAPSRAGRLAQGALGVALAALAFFVFRDDRHPFWWFAALTPLLACAPLPGRSPLGPVLRYLVTLYASVVLTHAVFFGEDRYHVVVTPVLAVLAAAALPRYPRACGQGLSNVDA